MKIGAAKAVGANARAPGGAVVRLPVASLVDQVEGGLLKGDVGILPGGVERGRQHLVVQSHDCFEQAGRACARFQVTDIALDRAEADAVTGRCAKHFVQALDFYHVANAGAGAVGLDQAGGGRV